MDEKTCIVFNAVIKYLDDKRPAKNRAKLTQPYSPHSKFHERKIRQEVSKEILQNEYHENRRKPVQRCVMQNIGLESLVESLYCSTQQYIS